MIIDEDATKFMYVDNKSKTYFSRPWVAYATIQNNDEVYQCGGAIINEKYVSKTTMLLLSNFPYFHGSYLSYQIFHVCIMT